MGFWGTNSCHSSVTLLSPFCHRERFASGKLTLSGNKVTLFCNKVTLSENKLTLFSNKVTLLRVTDGRQTGGERTVRQIADLQDVKQARRVAGERCIPRNYHVHQTEHTGNPRECGLNAYTYPPNPRKDGCRNLMSLTGLLPISEMNI